MNLRITTAVFIITIASAACLFAASPANHADQLIAGGLNYLRQHQNADGGWQQQDDPPGVTAIVLRAFVRDSHFNSKTDFVRKGFDKLFSYQLDNGGIYQDMLANYNTAIAVSAIADANDPDFKPRLDRAIAYLKGLQWTENSKGPDGKPIDKSNPWYGGWGYGHHARPDLSNAQFALQALHDSGLKSDDPAFKAALIFLTRSQNNSETNDQPWSGNDGGFIYTPANGGASEAGEYVAPDGKKMLRSYGTMTYAGLKSMIYAGLTHDDPRVKAAMDWIRQHWTVDANPGLREAGPQFAQNGLYYYFYVYAHALKAYGQPIITDAKGDKHDWRAELIDKLASLQKPDGSWVGEKRWMETNPSLVTAYAVMALEETK